MCYPIGFAFKILKKKMPLYIYRFEKYVCSFILRGLC